MPQTAKTITCCYCAADTLFDLRKAGRGVLTCDACGARLSSAKMRAVVQKPVPVAQRKVKHEAHRPLDPRWMDKAVAEVNRPKKEAKRKKPKKRKGFLDRLEDIWDEIEDIID